MVNEHPELLNQTPVYYPSLAGQSFGPFQPAQQAPVEQGENSRANKLLSSSQAPIYATPYVPREPRQPTRPRHSAAVSPTISYSRVPVQQKVKTAKPDATAGGFMGRLLETEMTEKQLDEMAARLGPGKRGVEEEASEEMLCDDHA